MPLPNFSSRFPDVRQAFDYALEHGGARYELKDRGAATHWRQRAYHFRKTLWKELNVGAPTPVPTPYDSIVIRVEDRFCLISIGDALSKGVLSPLNESKPETSSEPLPLDLSESELEAQAQELMRKIQL